MSHRQKYKKGEGIPSRAGRARDEWIEKSRRRHAESVQQRYGRVAGEEQPIDITTREDILAVAGCTSAELETSR